MKITIAYGRNEYSNDSAGAYGKKHFMRSECLEWIPYAILRHKNESNTRATLIAGDLKDLLELVWAHVYGLRNPYIPHGRAYA